MSIVFRTETPPDLIEELRQIPGVKAYETAVRCTPDIAPVVAQLLGIPGTSTITSTRSRSGTRSGRAVTAASAAGTKGWDRLTQWQREAATALAGGSKFGLVHPCGSGKSATVLAALDLIDATRALVITRSIGREAYARDAAWISDRKVALLIGTSTSTGAAQARRTDRSLNQYRSRGADCIATSDLRLALASGMDTVVVGWETLAERCDEIGDQTWSVLVCDEAHMSKGRTSRRCKAAHELRKIIPRCWTATATPVRDRLRDLWAQLYLVSPEAFRSSLRFAYRYCDAKPGRYGGLDTTGASHTDELKERLCYWWDIRSAEETRAGLPAKRRTTVRVPASKRNGTSTRSSARYSATSTIEAAIATAAAAKIDTVAELAAEALIADQKVVIVGNRRAWLPRMVSALEAALRSAPRHIHDRLWIKSVSGEVPIPDRLQVVGEYMDRPGAACLIATIDSISESINLHDSDLALVAALPYTPGQVSQFEGRFCVLEGQLVPTKHGTVPIERVEIGDEVMSHNGKWQRVTATRRRSVRCTPGHGLRTQLLTEISYRRYNKPLITTHDHRVLVRRQDAKDVEWAPASSVLPGDHLVLPRPTGLEAAPNMLLKFPDELRHRTRKSRYAPMPRWITIDQETAWLLGLYLGDGWSTGDGRQIGIAGNTDRPDILERSAAVFTRWGLPHSFYHRKGTKSRNLIVYSSEANRWFKTEFGEDAYTKRIPSFVFDLPSNLWRDFTRGYLDADGHRAEKRKKTEWSTVSDNIALQMPLLLAGCGESPTTYRATKPVWVGSMSDTKGRLDNEKFCYQLVTSVRTRYADRRKEKYVYDLEVDGDESFVVGLVAVHNCRLGQRRPVLIQYLVADRTIDEEIECLLLNKLEAAEEAGCIVDGTGLDTGLRMSESEIVAGLEKWLSDQSGGGV